MVLKFVQYADTVSPRGWVCVLDNGTVLSIDIKLYCYWPRGIEQEQEAYQIYVSCDFVNLCSHCQGNCAFGGEILFSQS